MSPPDRPKSVSEPCGALVCGSISGRRDEHDEELELGCWSAPCGGGEPWRRQQAGERPKGGQTGRTDSHQVAGRIQTPDPGGGPTVSRRAHKGNRMAL